MKEKQLFHIMSLYRKRTIELVESIDEGQFYRIPQGLRNNILWNIGHLIVSHDLLFEIAMSGYEAVSTEKMRNEFSPGTSPADWNEIPLSKTEALVLLKEQLAVMEKNLNGRLEEPLANEFKGLTSIGDMVVFAIGHETYHQGMIRFIHMTDEKILIR